MVPKGPKTRPLTEEEGEELMRLNGEMSYSLTGRPDAMGRVVMSQQNVNGDWCVAHLDEANRALQDIQDPDRYKCLTYRPLYEDYLKLVVVADAAMRKKESKYAQLCNHVYLQEVFPPAQLGGRIHVIDYRSKKATRVSNYSSMKAELLGQNRGSELAQRYSG